ncbi:MAG: hypothetical protein IK094_01075, partial [Treponema sp.]|nr:hypothetical protein [Treponema sp.]
GKLAHIPATYKMVDTCAGEFNAETPYFYAGYDEQNEAQDFLNEEAAAIFGDTKPFFDADQL